MNAIYLGQDQNLDDQVIDINGAPGAYGTLIDVVSTHPDMCWGAWACCDAIPVLSNTITSIVLTNPLLGPYIPSTPALVGGRPPRPIAK